MKSIKVYSLQLDKAIFLASNDKATAGIEFKRTLPGGYGASMEMYLHPYGVAIEFRGRKFLVPWSKIETADLGEATQITQMNILDANAKKIA